MVSLLPWLGKEDRERLELLVVPHENEIRRRPTKEDRDGCLKDTAGLVDNAEVDLEVLDQGEGELLDHPHRGVNGAEEDPRVLDCDNRQTRIRWMNQRDQIMHLT